MSRELIKNEEGLSLKPYLDSKGLITIGYGRCLDTKPLTKREAEYLFEADYADACVEAGKYSWFLSLNEARQGVIISMCYQMGSIDTFKKMIAALEIGDFNTAADEGLDSKWAKHDSPARAKRHMKVLRNG